MLFYEFFKSNLGTQVLVLLKTDLYISGTLASVDPYLNIKLCDIRILSGHPGLSKVSVCSIRGSSIKYMVSEKNEWQQENLNSATRLKMMLDRCH